LQEDLLAKNFLSGPLNMQAEDRLEVRGSPTILGEKCDDPDMEPRLWDNGKRTWGSVTVAIGQEAGGLDQWEPVPVGGRC